MEETWQTLGGQRGRQGSQAAQTKQAEQEGKRSTGARHGSQGRYWQHFEGFPSHQTPSKIEVLGSRSPPDRRKIDPKGSIGPLGTIRGFQGALKHTLERVLQGPGGGFGVPLGPSGETRDAFGTPVGNILGRSVTKKCGTRHAFIKSFCYRFSGCIFITLRACLGLRRHQKDRFRMGGVVKIKVSLFFKDLQT